MKRVDKINLVNRLGKYNNFLWRAVAIVIAVGVVYNIIQTKQLAQNTNQRVEQFPLNYPLKFDTPQNVLREPPLFHLNETVDVQARFVNGTDKIVTVTAEVHWILVTKAPELNARVDFIQDPILLIINPGCSKQFFPNKRPNSVALITEKLFASGHKKVTWQIAGKNTVTSESNSGSQSFEVDNFSYVPDDVQIPNYKVEKIPDSCDSLK